MKGTGASDAGSYLLWMLLTLFAFGRWSGHSSSRVFSRLRRRSRRHSRRRRNISSIRGRWAASLRGSRRVRWALCGKERGYPDSCRLCRSYRLPAALPLWSDGKMHSMRPVDDGFSLYWNGISLRSRCYSGSRLARGLDV